MFRNYFKTAWRNLRKNPVFSFINLTGLTLGITVCLLIFQFIINEWSVDNFHADGDRIYRVMRGFKSEGKTSDVAYVSGPYAPAMENDFGNSLEAVVRVAQNEELISIGDKSFQEKKLLAVDSNFFRFFSFPLVVGDASTALRHPNSIVITEATAIRYFGSAAAAMGKTVTLNQEQPLQVTGVAKNVPSNSHLEFDVLLPLRLYQDASWMSVWGNNALYTYVKLARGVQAGAVEAQFPGFMEKYMGSFMRQHGFSFTLSLMPLADVYFGNGAFDGVKHGDRTTVFLFLSIAALILIIACINFVNLSTVRAAERSREVGLRKTLGALRTNIIGQFIGESLLLTIISCVLAIGLVLLAMPLCRQLLGSNLSIAWNSWPNYAFLVFIVLVVGVLAGSYPAMFLSRFAPIEALKGKLRLGKSGASFRQVLVVIQFSISVFLIVGSIFITRQMDFVKNKQLGYDQEQTLIVRISNAAIYQNMQSFKNALQNESRVRSVSLMSGEPGGFFDGYMFEAEGHNERWNARTEFADFEWMETLGLRLLAGRNFSASFPTDTTNAALINATAAKRLGWTPEQAIGKWISNTVRDTVKRTIVGVVADFNFQSLKSDIEPLVIAPNPDRRLALIRLKPGNIPAAVAAVEKAYKAQAAGYPFEYSFLDQQFEQLYQKDVRQQQLLNIFAALAIFVACLGLFGLASFTVVKRFKEIGVRKLLGSSVQNIVFLLSKDLLQPVFLATCIALPIGYWAMHKWLESFAYKTELSWWVFALAALVTFAIAFITIAVKAIGAAMANPIKSLKTD